MAINLRDVKKSSKEKSEFYKTDTRAIKENETLTPWKSFTPEEDLIDKIKSRDSVTKRIERKKFTKHMKKEASQVEEGLLKKKIPRKPVTDKMLQNRIKQIAGDIFSRIN